MAKLILNDVGDLTSFTTAAAVINANSLAIETAMENTLSRDGTVPNTMGTDFDMNSNQILNLPAPSTPNGALRLQDLSSFIGGGTITVTTSILASTPMGRLTLTSGVAITSSDVTAATTVFYTAGQSPISDGTNIVANTSAQLSIALDSNNTHTGYHQAGKNFDVFKINDAGSIRIGTGPTWNAGGVAGSDIIRGTGVGSTALQALGNTGFLVNANSITIRFGSAIGNTVVVPVSQAVYLGTFRTTADGQTEDSLAKRFVWNAWNQVLRPMRVSDAVASFNYSSATIQQFNANVANQLDFVMGLSGTAIQAEFQGTMSNSTATFRAGGIGIGLDSAIVFSQGNTIPCMNNAGFGSVLNKYRAFPGLGRHFLSANQSGAGVDTQTWYGSPYMNLYGELLA